MSAYLSGVEKRKSKKAWEAATNRTTKFVAFDGQNRFQALEYEVLNMVSDFTSSAIILVLRPPIMVRNGLFLLNKRNCEVLHQSAAAKVKVVENLP